MRMAHSQAGERGHPQMSAAAGLPAPEGSASILRFPIYLGLPRPEPWSISEQDLVDVAAGGRRLRDVSLPPSFPEHRMT